MKTLSRFMFFAACIALFVTCQKDDQVTDDLSGAQLKKAQPHTVTVPFKADLLGTYTGYDEETAECINEGYACHTKVDVIGNATQMGKVSIKFDFCACGPDDPSVPGTDYRYAGGNSELIAANGDILYLHSEGGTVIEGRTDQHPEYVINYWKDQFTVTGGTGKFEGATGTIMEDDYNSSLDEYSHHHWTGTLTLVKGNMK